MILDLKDEIQGNESIVKDGFSHCRLLWNAIGHGLFTFLSSENITMLTKSSSLIRDIKGLDRKTSRQLFKAALIYVGKEQEDEQSILNNSVGSRQYQEFVDTLGWSVISFK